MMDFNPAYYTRYKKVQFYPNDTDAKYGRIIAADGIGFTYEVTEANRECDKGKFFVSHGAPFKFKVIEE